SGLRGIVYREVLGLEEGRVEEIIEQTEAEIRTLGEALSTDRLATGLSPHAPYSLSRRLLSASADLARREGLRAAMHVAESPAEMEYLLTGTGPIAERLLPFTGFAHIPAQVVGARPLAYLKACGLWGQGLLLVHGVHLTETECRGAAEVGATVAYCPRSNAFLRVGRPPLAAMLEAGLPVGLGTDSLASNTSLSLWDELRFAATDQPGLLTPAGWMAMATLGGARALGLEAQGGSLTPGKRADLIAVRAPSRVQDLAEYLVWEGDPDRIALCLVDGAALPGGPGADLPGMSRAMAGPATARQEWR
ncbi:MAG: amidohydrolase family protein, partial [Candidatus Methylomirabilales bacterium]